MSNDKLTETAPIIVTTGDGRKIQISVDGRWLDADCPTCGARGNGEMDCLTCGPKHTQGADE